VVLRYMAAMDQSLTVSSAHTSSNGEWIAKCVLQGFFLAPIEALPAISITDVVSAPEIQAVVLNICSPDHDSALRTKEALT
jgi:hypothetical protein